MLINFLGFVSEVFRFSGLLRPPGFGARKEASFSTIKDHACVLMVQSGENICRSIMGIAHAGPDARGTYGTVEGAKPPAARTSVAINVCQPHNASSV
jgi:hypothetical protein